MNFREISERTQARRQWTQLVLTEGWPQVGFCGAVSGAGGRPCGLPQHHVRGGTSCADGHGGAPTIQMTWRTRGPRESDVAPQLPSWARKFVVIDFETTGLSSYYDRIIEVGFALFEDGVVTKTGDYYVDPEGRAISEKITQITGITREMLHGAPRFWEVWNDASLDFYDATPVGYNGSFDKSFLMHSIARCWPRHAFRVIPPCADPAVRWVDVWPLVVKHSPDIGRAKLTKAAEYWGVELMHAHRADADCIATGQILLKLIEANWYADAGRGTNITGDAAVSWDSLEDVIRVGREQAADIFRKRFYGEQKKLPNEERAFLPRNQSVRIYECDLCYKMFPGQYRKSGWTMPERWCTNDAGVTTCGPACDLVRMWHDGSSGTDWTTRGVSR